MVETATFDLDGTLLDSAPLVARLFNGMRERRGMPPLAEEFVRPWISLGALELISRGLEANAEKAPGLVEDFHRRYRELPTPAQSLYPGVREGCRFVGARH